MQKRFGLSWADIPGETNTTLDSCLDRAAVGGLYGCRRGDQIRALPGDARASGRAIVLDGEALKGKDAPLRVAGDWTLRVPEPWKVNANGVCEGGSVEIGNQHGKRVIAVASPFCDPRVKP